MVACPKHANFKPELHFVEAAWTFGNHWAFQTKSHWIHLSHLWCLKVREECVCVQFLVKGDLLQFFPLFFHQVIVLGQGICWLSIQNNAIRTIELASGFIDFYYSKQEICQSMTPWNFFLQKLRHFSAEKDLVYILVSYFTLHHGSFSNHRRQTEICLWVILFDILFSTESTL